MQVKIDLVEWWNRGQNFCIPGVYPFQRISSEILAAQPMGGGIKAFFAATACTNEAAAGMDIAPWGGAMPPSPAVYDHLCSQDMIPGRNFHMTGLIGIMLQIATAGAASKQLPVQKKIISGAVPKSR